MKASIQDLTLAKLRELIIRGELKPGQRLIELDLCSRLNVSRTPIRHAFAVLAQERLVKDTPAGFVVRSISREEVAEAAELSGLIESLAVKSLASRSSKRAVLRDLRSLLTEGASILEKGYITHDDLGPFARMNGRFHFLLQDAGSTPLLADMMSRLRNLTVHSAGDMPFALESFPKVYRLWNYGQYQHESLVAAIETGNVERAVALSREHAITQREALQGEWREAELVSRIV